MNDLWRIKVVIQKLEFHKMQVSYLEYEMTTFHHKDNKIIKDPHQVMFDSLTSKG